LGYCSNAIKALRSYVKHVEDSTARKGGWQHGSGVSSDPRAGQTAYKRQKDGAIMTTPNRVIPNLPYKPWIAVIFHR
jgi:hypothetical protein